VSGLVVFLCYLVVAVLVARGLYAFYRGCCLLLAFVTRSPKDGAL
jgi:hypothetical protein